jgi:hypothetical protein
MANGAIEDGIDIDDLEMFIDTLDAIEDSMENKAENIGKFIRNLESDSAAFKNEEDRLAKKRKSIDNKIAGLKKYTKEMLELANKDKMSAGIFNIRLQNNPPSTLILDESKIPSTYKVAQPDKLNGKELLADLKKGVKVEGAELAPVTRHIRFS